MTKAAATMSRIRLRSANSLVVNHEKPNAVSALVGGSGVYQRLAAPGALEILARQEERLAVAEQRVGDSRLFRPVAPHPHQNDGVPVFEQQQDRMAERGRAQTVPIETGALGAQPELARQVEQTRDRDGVALDQVAPADRAGLGIDPVLRAEAKETSQRRLGRDDIAGRGSHRLRPNSSSSTDVEIFA